MPTRVAALGLALCLAPRAVAHAQRGEPGGIIGTIVIAHGGDSAWNARVRAVTGAVKTGGPVEVSFLMGPGAAAAPFQQVVARLEERGVARIVVVPMLVSSHSGHYDQIRYLTGDRVQLSEAMHHHLRVSGITPARARVPIRLTPALDDAPQLAQVLADRALTLTSEPTRRALLIVGHGPNSAEDYAAWMKNLRVVADSVKAHTGFRDVRVELVRDDASPAVRAEAVRRVRELIDLQRAATGLDVIVVPVLIAKGEVSRDRIPADIRGTPSVYSGEVILPHPAMVDWIEARVGGTR